MGAGNCTISEETIGPVKKIKWDFTAGSGASINSIGSATTSNTYNGKILLLATIGDSGATAPSASWDITVKDQSSVDVLAGGGANRAATSEWTVAASLGAVANDKLTLGISNTGASNGAQVYVFIR
jgi:hypothetical protein